MGTTAKSLLFIALLLCVASAPYALNYMYLSDTELTVFNERIPFENGDTIGGPVRTNDQFALTQRPVFYDYVIQSADSFLTEDWTNPFFGYPSGVIFGAPTLPWPENANWHREQAIAASHYLDQGDTMRARVRLNDDSMRVWFAGPSQVFDSVSYNDYPIGDSAIYWIQAPIEVSGTVSSTLILCTSADAGLADNILYVSSEQTQGRPDRPHSERFALIAEGSIVILNTPANGRENSSHGSHIALNGLYAALGGSFTFAQQNDADSGYVCDCAPDNRGYIYLWGGIVQRQAGYIHRSNRTSTGYRKYYSGDYALTQWNTGLFPDVAENVIEPTALEFDTIAPGQQETLFVRFTNEFVPLPLADIYATEPYHVDSTERSEAWVHDIPVIFAPSFPAAYNGFLTFWGADYTFEGQTFSVPLHGVATGLAANDDPVTLPSPIALSAYPNPFNNQTTISFSLPQAGPVTLTLFDLLGREVRTLTSANYRAGDHNLSFNAAGLQSGLYFTNLQTAGQSLTTKLMLIK